MKALDQQLADTYADWFRCLADGTRIKILNIVASAGDPVTVGEIVQQAGRSQSTVSHHLKILAAERFIFIEQEGIRTYVKVNTTCMTALPEAALAIMGRS